MAQESSDASVASSSPTPNWWEIHANPISSWNTISRWQPSSSSTHQASRDDDMSISTSSAHPNHSGPSIDSSTDISGEPVENHLLWSQVLSSVGGGGALQDKHNGDENFLEVLSSKSHTTEMFYPGCYSRKKLDGGWGLSNSPSFNSLERQLSNYDEGSFQHERHANSSNLVSNWSIAPPNPEADHQITPSSNPSMARYMTSNISHMKHELPNSPSYLPSYMPYIHENKGGSQHIQLLATKPSLLRPISSTSGTGHHIGLNNSAIGLTNKFINGVADAPWSNTRNLSDVISFNSRTNRPSAEFPSFEHISVKSSDSLETKKRSHETSSSSTKRTWSSGTTSEGKKKRSEDSSDGYLMKKANPESSTASSLKLQAPKAKFGDRIPELQKIVSPFGKTDTASVLLEAINYIQAFQEQVELLSDPYMKSVPNSKDHNSWGGLERKDKTESKLNLRSRGLCLVPISSIPPAYSENTGPDYWTTPYRGCLYR